MAFAELRLAVTEAYGTMDHTRCFALLDEFIATADGEELGKALSLKAAMIALVDESQARLGLGLVDQALVHLNRSPGRMLLAVVNGLALCHLIGDAEKAEAYATTGYALLRNYADAPEIVANRYRLHISLGQHADREGDLVQAYWHYNQTIIDLTRSFQVAGANPQHSLFWSYIHCADVCLKMRRPVEALEAIENAAQYVFSETAREKWESVRAAVQTAINPPIWWETQQEDSAR